MLGTEMLVYVAGVFYVLGLLIINQLALRCLLLMGTAFYILYYWHIADSPLWDAILISGMIGLANLFGILALIARKSRFAIPRAHRDIYDHFPDLPPGDFRTLMGCAKRYTLDHDTQLILEGAASTHLYYAVSGHIEITKKSDSFPVAAGAFLGEIAYLTNQPASASTTVSQGSEILEWSSETLRRLSRKSVRFKMALEAALSVDMAQKVAHSVAPSGTRDQPEATRGAPGISPPHQADPPL